MGSRMRLVDGVKSLRLSEKELYEGVLKGQDAAYASLWDEMVDGMQGWGNQKLKAFLSLYLPLSMLLGLTGGMLMNEEERKNTKQPGDPPGCDTITS